MRDLIAFLIVISAVAAASSVFAACPLDHVSIGCNADGTANTEDDYQLWLDKTQLYRHSDPDNETGETWAYWFYPLVGPDFWGEYYWDQPGFHQMWSSTDDTHKIVGTPNVDYRLIAECLRISPGLRAEDDAYNIIFSQPGDTLNLSALALHHAHLFFIAADPDRLYWITLRIRHEFINPSNPANQPPGGYAPSDEYTIVFGELPDAGDIYVDGAVKARDLAKLAKYWLCSADPDDPNTPDPRQVDYFDRADINRDHHVDLCDFAELAANWPAAP
jgi:hypothetical protein